MEASDENVQQLLAMGFPDAAKIRRALRLGRNDLSEAVAILTNEHPSSKYDTLDDVEMKDPEPWESVAQEAPPIYGPFLPPSYEEVQQQQGQEAYSPSQPEETLVTTPSQEGSQTTNGGSQVEETGPENRSLEFPVANLYELEGRVFTDQWSIPYKKDESLGQCLVAATWLAKEGLADSDKWCSRFIEKCMPESFQKLMTSGAVHRWGSEIQEGVYTMLQLLVDLSAARLHHSPVPLYLMDVLAMALDPDTEYHFKNRSRRADRIYWDDKLGSDGVCAVSPSGKDPYGWLANIVNRFAEKKGFEQLQERFKEEDLDAQALAALLAPFGNCVDFLNTDVVKPMLAPGMNIAVKYVQNLDANSLKEKKAGSIMALLVHMKVLSLRFWPEDVGSVDKLRYDTVLRMLQSPHFNAKMNALKEITQWIKEINDHKPPKTAMTSYGVLEWLNTNQILSLALEGNIDQLQYCEKIKHIVDFLGEQLSTEELSKIWKMQAGQANVVMENIYTIIAFAGVTFNVTQLDHLFMLIQKSWQTENDKTREKLLNLIGKIGKHAKVQKTTVRVLELLWDLAHLPGLPTPLMEQALQHHLTILTDSYTVKDQVKRSYIVKCVDDIKEGSWVLPAVKQLLQIAKNITKHSLHKAEKGLLQELNRSADLIKLVVNSLVKFHQLAASKATGTLSEYTLVDGRYTHQDYMTVHLNFLQFILQEGVLYLHWNRTKDIWETLVTNSAACDWDTETCMEWFTKGIGDLEQDTQSQLFTKEILKFTPAVLSAKGFACFKCYFENVNHYEHKLKRSGTLFVVEKVDLSGMDFLWELCLSTPCEQLADDAIKLLLNVSYQNLSARLKRDPAGLHKKFIQECYSRLEIAMSPLGVSSIPQLLHSAARILTAPTVPEAGSTPTVISPATMLGIERLLLIAEKYVLFVEEVHTSPRTILPHGASFHGTPLSLYITSESPKMEFSLTGHSNEGLLSVREKIGNKLNFAGDQIQIVANDNVLSPLKDQKMLHQLGVEDQQVLLVRTFGSAISTQTVQTGSTGRQVFDLEQEKQLPGVVMALGGQVFDMLYQLADLEEPKVTTRARNLLQLIPTDPNISDLLESLGQKPKPPGPEDVSPRNSPRASPRKYIAALTAVAGGPRDTLKLMFDANATNMSSFRVLYNLEVLSSKLMPTVADATIHQGAVTFCQRCLEVGGLDLVLRVLHKDGLAADADYKTRQGCYAICLQLLRYLLCGQAVTGEELHNGVPPKMNGVKIAEHPVAPSPVSASKLIQTMSITEFSDTVACLMRVAWAAAAGRLHLATSTQPIKDTGGYNGGSRSRQSSAGSTTSSGSDSEALFLQAGVCVKQEAVSAKDALIAQEAIELLVTCLQLRSQLLTAFYNLPFVSDFIIDVLVGCSHNDIRNMALDQFYLLSQSEVDNDGKPMMSPHKHMLQILLKARLPFWVCSTNTRGASQRKLKNCTQYFWLRSRLLQSLSVEDQQSLNVNIGCMLDDEISWLDNFVPSKRDDLVELDNTVLAGHLKLVHTLLACEDVDKVTIGRTLIPQLLHRFLFPASTIISQGKQMNKAIDSDFNPMCSSRESRLAAYEVLVELANQCPENMQEICLELTSMHHHSNTSADNQWEYMPPVESRASSGFVGLKNGGATCYMNSVLQQLYMVPGVSDSILALDDDHPDEDSILYQLQQVYGHLQESQLKYHVPESFWRTFKLWGQPINIREQQDAFDFYTALIDQIDEQLKKMDKSLMFQQKLQGVFSDQKICKECPHRYEREEVFMALNVTVKNATLQDSLAQFVKGELLEGDNAYFCEKCGEKRDTVKRMCIKSLPPVLCIQLKRFGYDWEANRALKFDDHFEFPLVLDMEPYTVEGVAAREESQQEIEVPLEDQEVESGQMVITSQAPRHLNYELVGVVVHSGQANAGHYYSFIKDRRGSYMSNPHKGKWFKFNDMTVEEFEMTEFALENECFGGTFKANIHDLSSTGSSYPEDRQRYWNGYLLFYERVEDPKTPVSAKKSKVIRLRNKEEQRRKSRSDSFVELTELVHKGDKSGLFPDSMPARVQQLVQDENLQFMRNRDIYDIEYFRCLKHLTSVNIDHTSHESFADMNLQAVQLATHFLFNTYFRTKKKLRLDMGEWVGILDKITQQCRSSCLWLVEYLATDRGRGCIKPFLLECPNRDIRLAFARILEKVMSGFYQHGGIHTHKLFDELLEHLLSMLNKDVIDNMKHCTQYFWLLSMYVQMQGTKACTHMIYRKAFPKLMIFLLGSPGNNDQEEGLRRWSSMQAREFGPLHDTLATLVLNCDLSSFTSEDCGKYSIRLPTTVTPQIALKMQPDMELYVYGAESIKYIREAVLSMREVCGDVSRVVDMLTSCSFCNAPFSISVLKLCMLQYANAPSNELKGFFNLLHELLVLEDPLQQKRLQCVVDGFEEEDGTAYEGLLAVIKTHHMNDSRRSYQCIKFLVTLASACPAAKEYLLQTSSKWQWAVNWLSRKMTERYWQPQPSAVTSNEDSDSRSFQRTISAQVTLESATALMKELESLDQDMDMDVSVDSSEKSEVTEVKDTDNPQPGSSS